MRSSSAKYGAREVPNRDGMAPLSHMRSARNMGRLRKFQCALFQFGMEVELPRLARKIGLARGAHRSSAEPGCNWRCFVIRDDNFDFRWFTKQMSAELVEKKGAIPEVGERSPETGFATLVNA